MIKEIELQEKINSLKRDNEALQKDLENDIEQNSNLIIRNKELEEENRKLKEENQNLQKQIKEIESDAIKLMDKMLELQLSNDKANTNIESNDFKNMLKCQTGIDKLE